MKLIVTISFCFACLLFTKTFAQVDVQDSLALVDLYDSTEGANWVNHTNWLTAAPVSSWYGITVNGNRINRIKLDFNNITGIMPASIGNLDSLVYLNLSHNPLAGRIPAELGNLSNLQELYFNNNQLSGSIPAELGNLLNLKYLYLDVNQLSGTIPAELGNLSNLYNLVFHTISLAELFLLNWEIFQTCCS